MAHKLPGRNLVVTDVVSETNDANTMDSKRLTKIPCKWLMEVENYTKH